MPQRYKVYVVPPVWKQAKRLPGFVRQRVKKAIDALAEDPRPPKSRELRQEHVEREVRRLRIEDWRLVYAIDAEDRVIDVIAIRKRPPYNYDDLADLISKFL